MVYRLKRKVRAILNRLGMFNEFYHDYREYKRWNYNNPKVKTQCAQEAKILRQTHMLEKGMALSHPRKGFGQKKIEDLFEMLEIYLKRGFPKESIPFQNAICVLNHYNAFQRQMGYENEWLNRNLMIYQKYLVEEMKGGIAHGTLSDMLKDINGKFPEFFKSRHSMRQFSDREIDFNDIYKSVELAMKAPTACNRQASKVYFYEDTEINERLGELISGNTGFDDEVQKYLVITANLSAFYDTFERNQIYVEAGFFAMSLVLALHYYGIGSCVLQNGETHSKNQKLKSICNNIPENEKIIMFIAIGYYKEEYAYAISNRKRVEDVLIV